MAKAKPVPGTTLTSVPVAPGAPPAPAPMAVPKGHKDLVEGVRKALYALPPLFRSEINISSVLVTDLQNFNSVLGASIEEQVTAALNTPMLREIWDPTNKYALYNFHRQPQTFPDVVLSTRVAGHPSILMGIELKGWYVLAKEGVPTFRMQASPKVCEPQDLVAVFPWALSNATSGSPRLFFPFVQSAKYVAEYRNWHWQHERRKKGLGAINFSAAAKAYPSKSEKIDDEAVDDKGDNFGRIARTGLMDAFVTEVADERLLGVAVDSWQKFLNIQKAGRDPAIIAAKVEGFAKKLRKPISDEEVVELGDLLVRLAEILRK